jgi:hypothetical protein
VYHYAIDLLRFEPQLYNPAMANPNWLEGHIFEKTAILRAKIWIFSKDLIDFAPKESGHGWYKETS